jgi:hypothetical protein
MSRPANGAGALRRVLENAGRAFRCNRNELTALSRLDTPAGHRDGAWLAEQLDRAVGPRRSLISSSWDWVEATRALAERKTYGDAG